MPKHPRKRPLAEQLEEVVQGILVSLQPRPEAAPHRNLALLSAVARELRYLPREEFRATLKSDLQRRASMSMDQGTESSAAAAPAEDPLRAPGVHVHYALYHREG